MRGISWGLGIVNSELVYEMGIGSADAGMEGWIWSGFGRVREGDGEAWVLGWSWAGGE